MDVVREMREWHPLGDLLSKIPKMSAQNLFFGQELSLTCVAVVPEFAAIGTDAGLVFWYNRATGDMQKLRCDSTASITCLHVVSSVEFLVAAGNVCGQVNVFQIQKDPPPDIDRVIPMTRSKKIERYTIRNLHNNYSVRCVFWSKNGMKLFSGDQHGSVVLTEFDQQMHIKESNEILNETYDIVQIDFRHPWLLVSTSYRAVVCERINDFGAWRVLQIGTKDRKQLSAFGVAFLPQSPPTTIVCARPGFCFWLANVNGDVQHTIIFKDGMERINQSAFELPLLNPGRQSTIAPVNFGRIHMFSEDILVTVSDNCVYLLQLVPQKVIGCIRRIPCITDLFVCPDGGEMFLLDGSRNLVRIANRPEIVRQVTETVLPPFFISPHVVDTIEFGAVNMQLDAEECFELPPISLKAPLRASFDEHAMPVQDQRFLEHSRKVETFERINDLAYDQSIVFKPKGAKRKPQGKVEMPAAPSGVVEIGRTAVDVFGDVDITGETNR